MEQTLSNNKKYKYSYYVFSAQYSARNCIVCYEDANIRAQHSSIDEGVSYSPGAPIELHMWEDHKGTNIPDYVRNTEGLIIVSNKVRALMEQHVAGQIEFLPCVIYDHKKHIAAAKGTYWIANLLGIVDCLNRELSDGSKSGYEIPYEYDILSCVVLDREKIPADLNLFRLASLAGMLIIRDDLRTVFDSKNIKPLQYVEQGEYDFM